MRPWIRLGLAGLWPILLAAGEPSERPPLPEPLSLTAALALADEDHPDLLIARAAINQGKAGIQAAEAADDPTAHLFGRARWVDPPSGREFNQENEDHNLRLVIRKPLYDFGRTASGEAAARSELDARTASLLDARQRRHIGITEAFFDVLLADITYDRDNEEVAFRFTVFQKIRDRHELGQRSDVELLDAESGYRKARTERIRSDSSRRATRSRLAMKLNRPGQLPNELLAPELPGNERQLPELADLETQTLQNNSTLRAARAKVAALKNRIEEASAHRLPTISGEIEAATYERELSARDSFRAGIYLEMPLYLGNRVQAQVSQRRAELDKARAEVTRLEWAIRQEVLDLLLELESLQLQREDAQARVASSDLTLDHRLALRELEKQTSIGNQLVETASARLHRTRTEYQIALAWARLDALIGLMPEEIVRNALGEANE